MYLCGCSGPWYVEVGVAYKICSIKHSLDCLLHSAIIRVSGRGACEFNLDRCKVGLHSLR